MRWTGRRCRARAPHTRAGHRIARTFQTPRLVGEASVLENVMIGGTHGWAAARFVESLLALPRHRHDEAHAARGGDGGAGAWSGWSSLPPCDRTGCSTASCGSWRSRAR